MYIHNYSLFVLVLRSWLAGYADQYLYQEARRYGAEKQHLTSRLSTAMFLDSLRSDTFRSKNLLCFALRSFLFIYSFIQLDCFFSILTTRVGCGGDRYRSKSVWCRFSKRCAALDLAKQRGNTQVSGCEARGGNKK